MSPVLKISTEDLKKADINELLHKLSTSKKGLSSSDAKERIQQYGLNEIPEKKVNPIVKFLGYFWGRH
jgi:H+-transporting ATPase